MGTAGDATGEEFDIAGEEFSIATIMRCLQQYCTGFCVELCLMLLLLLLLLLLLVWPRSSPVFLYVERS